MREPIGIIAGDGKLPLMLADGIRRAGHSVVGIGHRGITSRDFVQAVDRFHWVYIGQLGRIIDRLKDEGVKGAIFAGAVSKSHFFSRPLLFMRVRPDERAIRLLNKLPNRKDDIILRAIAAELEQEGIRVLSPAPFVSDSLAPQGCWTKRQPTEREKKDILFGWEAAKEIGRLDIGQTIVLKDQMILAIEGVEGTDATIRRGGKLGGGEVLVIKVSKPDQDLRLDLPVIGPGTIRSLVRSRASALVVEAGKTIVLERERTIREADCNEICLLAM